MRERIEVDPEIVALYRDGLVSRWDMLTERVLRWAYNRLVDLAKWSRA